MFADPASEDYVHPAHLPFFAEAAVRFHCHILVRKTGRASLSWIGKRGYTGKRGDLKAKTANVQSGRYPVAGLVCSPLLRAEAFTAERYRSARELWMANRHLITEPNDTVGFDDQHLLSGCKTPYVVQTRRDHPHYGCVALVESGLLLPRYVHGDYDLFAIIPAGRAFVADTAHQHARQTTMGTSTAPGSLPLAEREARLLPNFEGPLAFDVATLVNTRIAAGHRDLVGCLMVNHGEQVSWRKKKPDPAAIYLADGRRNKPDILEPIEYEPVLAISPGKNGGAARTVELKTKEEHERFYAIA